MFAVFAFILIFCAAVFWIANSAPDRMEDAPFIKLPIADLWKAVKLCRTAALGQPKLTLRPYNRQSRIELNFMDADNVQLTLPLKLKKDLARRGDIMAILASHGIDAAISKDTKNIPAIEAYLDRGAPDFDMRLTALFTALFIGQGDGFVSLRGTILSSDTRYFDQLKSNPDGFSEGFEFTSSSAKYSPKSVGAIKRSKIINAAYYLLYPAIIVFSYSVLGLPGLLWALIAFYGFYMIRSARKLWQEAYFYMGLDWS